MAGRILEYEAKTIYTEGFVEGFVGSYAKAVAEALPEYYAAHEAEVLEKAKFHAIANRVSGYHMSYARAAQQTGTTVRDFVARALSEGCLDRQQVPSILRIDMLDGIDMSAADQYDQIVETVWRVIGGAALDFEAKTVRQRAEERGALQMLAKLVDRGFITVEQAAEAAGVALEEYRRKNTALALRSMTATEPEPTVEAETGPAEEPEAGSEADAAGDTSEALSEDELDTTWEDLLETSRVPRVRIPGTNATLIV